MLLENDFPGDVRVDKEVQSLYEAGHKVVVASSTSKDLTYVEKTINCTIYRKKISPFILKSSVGALKFPFYFNFWRSFVKMILRKERIDAIHIHDLPLAKIGLEVKRSKGVKFIIDLHENYPALLEVSQHTNTLIGKLLSSKNQWRRYEEDMTKSADAVITVVQEMKNRISNIGVDINKIFVVENTPVNSEERIEKVIDENFFTITYIGGITEARGLQYIIKGLPILKQNNKNVRLRVAGDGKYLAFLKKLTEDLRVNDIVHFFGKVERSEAIKILSKTDIAVIPHVRSEQSDNSSPNKLFEYMSAGIPLIASDCKSIVRIVNEIEIGITYTYNSPEDFAQKVSYLIDNRDKLLIYSKNGIEAIKSKYNWKSSAKNLLGLYEYVENKID